MALKTDYKDDIPVSDLRKYQMRNNEDGTVSFIDVTEYEQEGDTFGAADINAINEAANGKMDSEDLVDPMLTTEEGFPADAKLTRDAIDELNSNLGVRYNAETDMIEIFYNGTWNEWKSGNLQTYEELIPVDGGTLVASSQLSGYGVDKILPNTTGVWYAEQNVSNASVTYTFPKQVIVNNFYVDLLNATTQTVFKVYVSEDLYDYNLVNTYTFDAVSGQENHTLYLDNIKCRAFRLEFTKYNYTTNGNYITLDELKIRGRVIE